MLTGKAVSDLFRNSLFLNEDVINGKPVVEPLYVEGIVVKAGFDPRRIEKNKVKVQELLNELPSDFSKGWTFLNMFIDKDKNPWTGFHKTCDELLCLGLAIGSIQYTMGRDMWDALPGGVPYIIIKQTKG